MSFAGLGQGTYSTDETLRVPMSGQGRDVVVQDRMTAASTAGGKHVQEVLSERSTNIIVSYTSTQNIQAIKHRIYPLPMLYNLPSFYHLYAVGFILSLL